MRGRTHWKEGGKEFIPLLSLQSSPTHGQAWGSQGHCVTPVLSSCRLLCTVRKAPELLTAEKNNC